MMLDRSNTTSTDAASIAPSGPRIIVESLYAFLAIGSVILFGLREMSSFSDEVSQLAELADLIVCALFWVKAAWDLYRAPSRLGWLRWGWADLLASIPSVGVLRPLRALRLIMMIRAIRSTTQGVHGIATYFNVDRTRSVATTVFALIVISVLTSSFVVLGVESGAPNANIVTAEDALWWAVSTLFGAEPASFGNHHAVTTGGRLMSLWLLILSLGLIGSLAGIISAWIEQEPDRQGPG